MLHNKIVVKNSLPKKIGDAPPWIENAPLGEAKGGMGAEKCFLAVLRYKFVFSKKFRLRRAFSKCCTVDYALLLQLCMSLLREL